MNPISYFIARNGQQLGPLTEEQIAQMRVTGKILAQDMVWHEGMNEWQPAKTVFGLPDFPVVPPPHVPRKKNSSLGWASLVIGGVMFVGWFALLIAAGVAHHSGANDQSPVMAIIGLCIFAGVGVNLLGIIFGIVPLMKSEFSKTTCVIGIILNGLELLGMVGIMIMGVAMQ